MTGELDVRHGVHAFYLLLARVHRAAELGRVVPVDDAVGGALDDLHRLQVLRRVLPPVKHKQLAENGR